MPALQVRLTEFIHSQFIEELEDGKRYNVNKVLDQLITEVSGFGGFELKSMRDLPIAILCIIGPSKGGKSFLLYFLIRLLSKLASRSERGCECEENEKVDMFPSKDGIPKWMISESGKIESFEKTKTTAFSITAGTTRNTRGILFWSEPFVITKENGEKVCVLVMDTQGLWDDQTQDEFNCSIFGLSCLLSSYTIYNQKGNMNTEQLRKFSVLSQFSKDVSKESGKPFQHLDLLMRDYEGYDLDEDKDVSTGVEYSERRLDRMRKGKIEGDIVKQIEDCFNEFGLFCLPHPGLKVAGSKYDGSIVTAEPLFMRLLSYYLNRIVGEIRYREIGGVRINGNNFVQCV